MTAAHQLTGDGDRSIRVDLLSELVGINSVNPLQAGERSGPGGEAALAEWVAARTEEIGAAAILDEAEPGRPNVYARFDGGAPHTVAIDVHLDTVGVEHVEGDPFAARVADGRVYGRGSVDTKATLAVMLPLLATLGPDLRQRMPTVYLVGTVGEEAGGLIGAHRFAEWAAEAGIRFDHLVVAEPTSCAPVHGHRGGVGLEITVAGRAAHSSKPELGANAITAAARIVTALDAEHRRLTAQIPTTPVGNGTLSVTMIEGGLARNIIPDECRLYAGRRTAPGEDPDTLFEELSGLVAEAAAPEAVAVERTTPGSPAFYESPECELVQTLCRLADTTPATAGYGSNALVYREIADQIVVFGPGSIDQAHQAVEWIEIDELDRAAAVYRTWLRTGFGQAVES